MASSLERLWGWLLEPLEQRSAGDPLDPAETYPDIDAQLYARQKARSSVRPAPTIKEALSIPAVYRAVTLLSTTAASLNLKQYVNQVEIDPSAFVRRPARAWTFGAFVRDTVMYMASRGEAIWLTLARDAAGFATDIVPVLPEALRSEWNGLRHNWYSLDKEGRRRDYDPEDVTHIPLLRDPSTGRGLGPMQSCGVALNVAYEADVWASRYFVGGIPSVFLSSQAPLSKEESQTLKDQWQHDPPNTPKVGYGIEPTAIEQNPEAAQLTASRMHSRGETALMFGIPGKLLEYSQAGSSLTYSNVGGLATELVRLTLAPVYLEQIEQSFSDLLPRGQEVRFDVEGFERADVKTRYETHKVAVETGIYTAEYAAAKEGIIGGSPEVVPAPLRRVV